MRRIIGARSSGKTRELMQLAKESRATFVCSNPTAMERKALAYGFTGIEFISYMDYASDFTGEYNLVVIDELEEFMRQISTPDSIVGYTLTDEE